MYLIRNCLSGNFIQKWEMKSHLERSLLNYFKVYQNGCISNMTNIFGANSSLASIPQWVTSSWNPVSSFLLFCSWRKCSVCVNTAGFGGAVGRQNLLLSSFLTQEKKNGSSETLWMILAVVTCFWPRLVVLIMLFYVSVLREFTWVLCFFIFYFLEMPL